MKKTFGIISIILVLLLLTGCTLKNETKENYTVFDYIKKLSTKDDLKTINKVMGFEGELINNSTSFKIYKWVINENKNETVQAIFYKDSTSISITFSDQDIKSSKVDFSKYEEIKESINNKEKLKYKDIKSKFKVNGVLVEKTSTETKYRWVNENSKYVNATFNNKTGYCTMISGMI